MRRPDLGRGFRARLVAVGVIGALMLSALPAASVSAVSPFDAVAVSIINLPPSAVSGQSFAFQVEAVNQFGTRDTGIIPNFIVSGNRVVDCVVSSLARADFETYVTKTIAGCTP